MKFTLMLVLTFISLESYSATYFKGEQLPVIDHQWMRFESTHVDILAREDRLFSRRFTLQYRVVISNPFPLDIECDVTLVSSRGINERYEVIDTQVHKGVVITALSNETKYGEIEAKEGRGTNGLLWLTNYGHEVFTSGCRYSDF